MTDRETVSRKQQKNSFIQPVYGAHECAHCKGTGEIADYFGARLKKLRLKNNYEDARFAKLIGISTRKLHMFENGTSNPGVIELLRMTEHLGCTSDYLLGLTHTPKAKKYAPT